MKAERNAFKRIYFPSSNKVCWTVRLSIRNMLCPDVQTNIVKSTINRNLFALRVFVSLTKACAFALAIMVPFHIAAADSRLLMVTSDHCPYCQAWELDVGAVYDRSPYAPTLPLTRIDIGREMPRDVTIKKLIVGTPTFLIIHNGQEIDRQSGYVDAEMFWWWLSEYAAK